MVQFSETGKASSEIFYNLEWQSSIDVEAMSSDKVKESNPLGPDRNYITV
jgi:hypothetical protein